MTPTLNMDEEQVFSDRKGYPQVIFLKFFVSSYVQVSFCVKEMSTPGYLMMRPLKVYSMILTAYKTLFLWQELIDKDE